MTDMIQVRGDFRRARVFIINARPDETADLEAELDRYLARYHLGVVARVIVEVVAPGQQNQPLSGEPKYLS
jgi:hypothetical protein